MNQVRACTLLCGLTPSGRIDVYPGSPDDGPRLTTAVQRRILGAFGTGRGHGVLNLGARELSTDLHPTLAYWRDIGKTLVATLLEANGFEVHDLGNDVPVERFLAKAREVGADIVAASALLTTTMSVQRELVKAVASAGLDKPVRVLVGGSPTTPRWADEIGAVHADNASRAVGAATALVS